MDKIFLVQREYISDKHNIEEEALYKLIRLYAPRNLDKYMLISLNDLDITINSYKNNGIDVEKHIVPVGNIEFVNKTLKAMFNREDVKERPIEIPEELYKYTNRFYAKLKGAEIKRSIDTRMYFIKDIDTLKNWNNLLYLGHDVKEFINDATNYSVSEIIDIISEYRVFVLNDIVIGCENYLGDNLTFPNKGTILSMINDYKRNESRPKAYTLDVAIINRCSKEITVPLEIHVFTSCGLYGFLDEKLLYMLGYGFQYHVSENKK